MRITKYKGILNEERTLSLVKEKAVNYTKYSAINSSMIVANMLNDVFQLSRQAEEHVYLICLNIKCKPIGVFEVSHGDLNGSYAVPREIFKNALLCNASSVIVAHNHPSGDCAPSPSDVEMYKRIQKAGEIIGIKLVDFLIIGDDTYWSAEERMR